MEYGKRQEVGILCWDRIPFRNRYSTVLSGGGWEDVHDIRKIA